MAVPACTGSSFGTPAVFSDSRAQNIDLIANKYVHYTLSELNRGLEELILYGTNSLLSNVRNSLLSGHPECSGQVETNYSRLVTKRTLPGRRTPPCSEPRQR